MSINEIDKDLPIDTEAKSSANFINVGERTNVTGSAMFKRLILNDEYEKSLRMCSATSRKWRADYRCQYG